jgi:hypothetical protein
MSSIAYFKLIRVEPDEHKPKPDVVNCWICKNPVEVSTFDKYAINDIVCCSCIDYAKDHYSW